MTHPWLTRKTVKQIQEELNGLEKIVHDATGKTTKPYFRPPYGAQNATVNKTASDLGWHDIMWNATAADAQFPRPTKDRVKGLIMALRPGSIYLCHSFVDTSVTALIESLPALKKKGIKVVRLSDLLEQHMKAVEAAELTKRNKGNTPKNFGQPSAAAPPKATR